MNLRKKVVFLDVSVLFSALYSSKGGSYALITSIKDKLIRGITSQTVVEELHNNIIKLPNISQKEIDNLLINKNILVCDHIDEKEPLPWLSKIEEKDIHVIVGAISTGCHYLATLDKKHLHNKKVQSHCKDIKIVTPKELLKLMRE